MYVIQKAYKINKMTLTTSEPRMIDMKTNRVNSFQTTKKNFTIYKSLLEEWGVDWITYNFDKRFNIYKCALNFKPLDVLNTFWKQIEQISVYKWNINGIEKTAQIVEWKDIKLEHKLELFQVCCTMEPNDIEQVVYHLSIYYEGKCPYNYESKCYKPWCECQEALNGCKGYY